MKRIPVYVVVPPRMLLLDMAGPLEVLRVANRDQSEVRFDVRYVGPSASVVWGPKAGISWDLSTGVVRACRSPVVNGYPSVLPSTRK